MVQYQFSCPECGKQHLVVWDVEPEERDLSTPFDLDCPQCGHQYRKVAAQGYPLL